MKKNILLLILFLSFSMIFSQESYTVKGEKVNLKTEVEGTLDLLWNIINSEYRYFVRDENGKIIELLNSKVDGDYLEEYKADLNQLTNQPTERLKLILPSLKTFMNSYNASKDSNYSEIKPDSKLKARLGFFSGFTNSPFVENTNNTVSPLLASEIEVFEENNLEKHALFLALKHVFEQNDFKYSTTEIALGYRFRFLNFDKFNIYANVKLVTLNFSKSTVVSVNQANQTIGEELSGTSFDAPIAFGIGADYKVSSNSYITLMYNELFALTVDNQGNFPVNVLLGYKINL